MKNVYKVDYLIFGAGMYGLYAALHLAKKKRSVAIVDSDAGPFMRASYINQARVHRGYHYPRSYSTAIKSAGYFERFNKDFECSIRSKFRKIYGISSHYSLTNGEQFEKFCREAEIPCRPIHPEEFFLPGTVDGAYDTTEYAYDAKIIAQFLLSSIGAQGEFVSFLYGRRPLGVDAVEGCYKVRLSDGSEIVAGNVLNSTYASVNQINTLFGFPPFSIKYEICEIILGKVSSRIQDVGVTVMDGPFFSMMPFGKTAFHSLTAVAFTPHKTSRTVDPVFPCQSLVTECGPQFLNNCNTCKAKPPSAWKAMNQLAKRFLREDIEFTYDSSLFSMKPILSGAELDDSRPTLIRRFSENPGFIAVLSGKINTVYDLEEALA
jgi:hypothetical protein